MNQKSYSPQTLLKVASNLSLDVLQSFCHEVDDSCWEAEEQMPLLSSLD